MKTLIINGSPKRNGDAAVLIEEFTKYLDGEIMQVSCFDNIAPCNDCRFCWKKEGCSIKDDMQKVYGFWEKCDNVVIASPIWFYSLSGPALDIASRFQTIYASKTRRKDCKVSQTKNGVILLTGAESGTEEAPERSAKIILRLMGATSQSIITVKSMNTDNVPAQNDETAKKQCRDVALKLNETVHIKGV